MAVKRQMLRDEVYETILEWLLAGRWKPEARLSIEGLARELEISPTPVREALAYLERSGLVERTALKGYQVAPPLTARQIDELIDARLVVETGALDRAFRNWDDLSADLVRCHTDHEQVVSRLDSTPDADLPLFREHFDADFAFHRAFVDHAHNAYLEGFLTSLGSHVHRMRQMMDEHQFIDADMALAEHAAILQNVLDRNHDGALRALHSHLELVRSRSLGGLGGATAGAPRALGA